jgi:hypothetical protein
MRLIHTCHTTHSSILISTFSVFYGDSLYILTAYAFVKDISFCRPTVLIIQ